MISTPNHQKKARVTKSRPTPTAESVLDDAIGVLHVGIETIRDEIEKIKAESAAKAAKNKYDKAARISYLAQKAGSIADSVRKAEAARAKRLDAITTAVVLAWFRGLDPSEQGRLMRELQQINTKRSGLA